MTQAQHQGLSIVVLLCAGCTIIFLSIDNARDGNFFSAFTTMILGAGLWFGALFKLL